MIGISTACTASAHSIGEAFRRIQDGEAKVMVAGGFDALTTWFDVLGFALLGALTTSTTTTRSMPPGRSTATGRGSCSARAASS